MAAALMDDMILAPLQEYITLSQNDEVRIRIISTRKDTKETVWVLPVVRVKPV
jgi:hypothetical protein